MGQYFKIFIKGMDTIFMMGCRLYIYLSHNINYEQGRTQERSITNRFSR